MIDRDHIMEQIVTRRKIIFWGMLSPEESKEYISLCELKNAWSNAWDIVRKSHERYKMRYDGPYAFLPDEILIRMEYLSRKGWGCLSEKQVRNKDISTIKES